MAKKVISIIIPVYNEEKNIERAYRAVVEEFKKFHGLEYEIIFTDNHSSDGTFEQLKKVATIDSQVRVLRFARNFGFQRSILTGYRYARGDAAIQIDCDLEDPPSMFSEFIRLWQMGHDVVVGIRTQRYEKHYMIGVMRWVCYKLLDRISEIPHEMGSGDFRLIDRSILSHLHNIDDAQPYMRGLITELASNQVGVPYARNKRKFGESKFPLKQLIRLALEGIFSYSTTPLRVASYLGIFIALLTAIMSSIYIVLRVFFAHQWPAGFTTTAVLILFGISLNSIFLGIMGEYIGRIYIQMRRRPLTIMEKTINIDQFQPVLPIRGAINGRF